MKWGAAVFVMMGSLVVPLAARDEPPLPDWDPTERDALREKGWIPGAILLTDDPIPEEEPAEPPIDEQPTAEELAEDEVPSTLIPEEYVGAYFAERPTSFLLDPQGLLSSKDYNDRLAFLKYHAGDSSIDLFFYVFTGDQEIPSDVRFEETIERLYSEGKPAAIVFYYVGAPQRSALYLSPSLTDVASAAEQRRALQSSVMQAFEHTGPTEQLAAFSVQMSIRIYWMERMLSGSAAPGDEGPLPARLAGAAMAPAGEKSAPEPSMLDDFLAEWGVPLGLGAGAVAVGSVLLAFLRLRTRHRFPDFEVEPRLGGPHAAGVGAVISFASASLPPATQRDQVPDYLRRI